METRHDNLLAALNLRSKEHVAVVGGGGKSTLCFRLTEALTKGGNRVIASTTTKVRDEEAGAYSRVVLFSFGEVEPDAVSAELNEVGSLFVGRTLLPNGKIEGISAGEADHLFRSSDVDHIIVEADGAAGLPLKAPAIHEPVIPESATVVIAVMGLVALGKPVGPEMVFRPALFKKLTGLGEGDHLDPEKLVNMFEETAGLFKNAPVSARRVAFLNQLDVLPDPHEAKELGMRLLSRWPYIERVVLGSLRKNIFITIC